MVFLSDREKSTLMNSACGDLIRALEECHDRGMMYKLMGGCNDQKINLAVCLRAEVSWAIFVELFWMDKGVGGELISIAIRTDGKEQRASGGADEAEKRGVRAA